ncbi:uncharacterized protein LOC6605688 [Drosophila sechellia]|uniref:GM24535 n=1 Tax=Drosophila sechellia TaxID=7238 RepID=B4HHS5_DROSE|nr:uncharacterized protein LOC6605688 [Drosophila sechellia]EDW41490.1 GM24535 [Drosophila sechellia]
MSEIEGCAEVDELDSEESGEERTPSFATEDLNDNAILARTSDSGTDTDLLSLSLSTTTVDGSQSSGTEESNLDLDTRLFGLRPVEGTTNLRPHSTLTSSPSGPQLPLSPPWQVIRRRLRSHREVINRPSGRFERVARLYTSEIEEMTRLITEFMRDLVNSRPSLEVQSGRNRMRAEGIARAHARPRLDARRVRAASLHRTALRQQLIAAEQLISAPNDQELPRANSVSDCSQCSSDEEQDQIDGKNRKPTVPSHLTEWLYPI